MKLFNAPKQQEEVKQPTRRSLRTIPNNPSIDYSIFSDSEYEIAELIHRRRLQVLVHSCIYYHFDKNLITDAMYDFFSNDLARLQSQHPHIASKICYADAFKNWGGGSGAYLPYTDPWVIAKAESLIRLEETYGKRKEEL